MKNYTAPQLLSDVITIAKSLASSEYTSIYPVPRGGMCFGVALSKEMNLPIVLKDKISEKTLVVDDIIDRGTTRNYFPKNDFFSLHKSINTGFIKSKRTRWLYEVDEWVHYFWEGEEEYRSIQDSVIRQLQYIGEDINREGLQETPKRVVNSWKELYSGYNRDPKKEIKIFGSEGYDAIILLKDIELYSMCEHHMSPFIGKAHIAYIPKEKIVGISKLARILEIFARRLQIQERIGNQVTEFLMNELDPLGAACIIEAQHLCMQMRGIQKQNSKMVTSSLKGIFLENQDTREELMKLLS